MSQLAAQAISAQQAGNQQASLQQMPAAAQHPFLPLLASMLRSPSRPQAA
jgi:hypothetical protein